MQTLEVSEETDREAIGAAIQEENLRSCLCHGASNMATNRKSQETPASNTRALAALNVLQKGRVLEKAGCTPGRMEEGYDGVTDALGDSPR